MHFSKLENNSYLTHLEMFMDFQSVLILLVRNKQQCNMNDMLHKDRAKIEMYYHISAKTFLKR